MKYYKSLVFLLVFSLFFSCQPEKTEIDVLVIGGGTGGTAAGIQSAKTGATTVIIEPTAWLGGMLTAAGVSATDGNHHMPAGIWGEFRDNLIAHYGTADSLETGWVSNTQFEPSVGAAIFQQMAEETDRLQIWFNSVWKHIEYGENGWEVLVEKEGVSHKIIARILIDGTDLGDVAASVGATFDVGMDAAKDSKENMAAAAANDIIQDFTYVAILKDYGEGTDKSIEKPKNYDPSIFVCACEQLCQDSTVNTHPCETMLNYAKLPNGKYMINWPIHGNDYYAPLLNLNDEERQATYQRAKKHTLAFIYFIQQELGYKNLGLADDEFPTDDLLPFIPYHREGRRIHGVQRLTVNHLLQPYDYSFYKMGIAVGDYPIDHHHAEMVTAPEVDFPAVPSFSIPLGCLIPKSVDHLIMADKAISVSNIVNGSSRLQPVVLQIGQAAGILAALASQKNISPKEIPIQDVQEIILANKGYILPFYDVSPTHANFEAIQKVAASGLLKGKGASYKWANRTWFYPDTTVQAAELQKGLKMIGLTHRFSNEIVTINDVADIFNAKFSINDWSNFGLSNFALDRPITRAEICVVVDEIWQPFEKRNLNY